MAEMHQMSKGQTLEILILPLTWAVLCMPSYVSTLRVAMTYVSVGGSIQRCSIRHCLVQRYQRPNKIIACLQYCLVSHA
jgi:hypothetical protein